MDSVFDNQRVSFDVVWTVGGIAAGESSSHDSQRRTYVGVFVSRNEFDAMTPQDWQAVQMAGCLVLLLTALGVTWAAVTEAYRARKGRGDA
jgi:hypothetical protein